MEATIQMNNAVTYDDVDVMLPRCVHCGGDIVPSNDIWENLTTAPGGNGALLWQHKHCRDKVLQDIIRNA